MSVDFCKEGADTVALIVDRAEALINASAPELRKLFSGQDRMSLTMDLMAANGVNGNLPLDLDRLLAADDFNFSHDVFGIRRHIDRETGLLGDCFVPRFARAGQ